MVQSAQKLSDDCNLQHNPNLISILNRKMDHQPVFHPLKPHNSKISPHSPFKSHNHDSAFITQQNTNSTLIPHMNHSHSILENNNSHINRINTPYLLVNKLPNASDCNKSGMINMTNTNRFVQCRNQSPSHQNIVVINNKRMVTNKSHSRSPVIQRISPFPGTVSRQRQMNKSSTMSIQQINQTHQNKDLYAMYSSIKHENLLLIRKVQILEKRVYELHKQKQAAVLEVLKQNKELKQEMELYKRNEITGSHTKEYLSEIGQLHHLREANRKMSTQIQQLRQKVDDFRHPFKVIELDNKQSSKQETPQVISLPESGEHSISRIIAQSHMSSPQKMSQINLTQSMIDKVSKTKEENQKLKLQIHQQNETLEQKLQQIKQLEEYVKRINNYIALNATLLETEGDPSEMGDSDNKIDLNFSMSA